MVAKGKCYSQLVQMLGTRTVLQRLAQMLVILAKIHGQKEENGGLIKRRVTHYQLANIVGSTRQWVSTTLEKWQTDDIIVLRDRRIDICRVDLLNDLLAA